MKLLLLGAIKFVWSSFVSYVIRRCSGEFLDELFDKTLETFAKSTKTTVDDDLLEKWRKR
ncbi:MAG: hypothetical protein ACRCX2_14890 [Paraclostridium sp.]